MPCTCLCAYPPTPLAHFLWSTRCWLVTAHSATIPFDFFWLLMTQTPSIFQSDHGFFFKDQPEMLCTCLCACPPTSPPTFLMAHTLFELDHGFLFKDQRAILCRLGGPQCSAWGQNQKWPTCGHSGYLTPAVSGVPNALHGDKIRNGPHVGTVAT